MNRSIDKPGELILTCGLSGSGKSTLARYAVSELSDNLSYLKTITTRPRRENEDTLEYTFADLPGYESLKLRSKLWDETLVYGNFYGVDAQSYINRIENGQNFIACTVPTNDIVDEMSAIYSRERIKTVYIPTLRSVAMERMQHRDTKITIARVAIDSAIAQEKFNADYTLELSDSLDMDKERFINIIRRIIT